ncbi:helix-turn-helix domain-containing protein [Streptomyces wuyuanensis]|uniref:helix-turn-helix domain-containing protein n=1 Tax=Streptomyces wuyuanensis TaxID=1196353 RepID=UPI0034228915
MRGDGMAGRLTWGAEDQALDNPDAHAACEAARLRVEPGRAVRERREALGTSQAGLARAAGPQQPAVARFEAGGTMPPPLPDRPATALGARLRVGFEPLDRAG